MLIKYFIVLLFSFALLLVGVEAELLPCLPTEVSNYTKVSLDKLTNGEQGG
jgi:hypothetical protein